MVSVPPLRGRLGGGCNDWLNKSLTKQSNFFDLCPYRRPWTQRHHVMTISVIITICHKTHTPSNARFVIHFWAQTGNEICPLGATCLPMLGNVLAPCGQRACPKQNKKYHGMIRS